MSIDSIVQSFMSSTKTLGAIVSVQQNGKTTFEQGYGSIGDNGPAPTPTNSFQIDSLTKSFTAIAVLRLWEQKTIQSLSDTLGTYVKKLDNPKWGTIQIQQLLAMVSGIPDSGSATETYKQCLAGIAGKPLLFTPGAKYDYSNSNFFLLGELIDAIGGSGGYPAYVTKNVLDVFGLPNTGLIPFAQAVDPVTPYENDKAQTWRNPDSGYSAGGFASTMADLETYSLGLLAGEVLQASTYELMWTNYTLNDGQKGQFGLGWDVVTKSGALLYAAKDGGGYGWGSYVLISPPNNLGVCILVNNNVGLASLAKSIFEFLS